MLKSVGVVKWSNSDQPCLFKVPTWYRYKYRYSLRDCYSFYPSFIASVLVKSLFDMILFSQAIILIDWEVGLGGGQDVCTRS